MKLFMNRCLPRPLRGLAFPNVHEKQRLKIKYFSEFFKDFLETEGVLIWALTVLFCYFHFVFIFLWMTSYEGAFITKIFKLYVLYNLKRSYYTLLNACYQSEVRLACFCVFCLILFRWTSCIMMMQNTTGLKWLN